MSDASFASAALQAQASNLGSLPIASTEDFSQEATTLPRRHAGIVVTSITKLGMTLTDGFAIGVNNTCAS
jgi:hypothetical protein